MPVFQYVARNEEGQTVSGKAASRDEVSLRSQLRKNNMFVVRVAEQRQTRFSHRPKVRLGDLIIMSRQLRNMALAGMPLVVGLDALAEQTMNPTLADILGATARAVSSGRALASALAERPDVFPEMLVTLIRSGEEAGRLPEALAEASRQMELQSQIRQKLISAMMYPTFVLFATFLTIGLMLIFIVPTFEKIYGDLKTPLPGPTQFLLWLSHAAIQYSWLVALLAAGAFFAFRRFSRTPEGRLKIDKIKLRMPLFGVLVRKSATANMTGSLAGLLESGVPLIPALQTSARVCGNIILGDHLRAAAQQVSMGHRLSEELEKSGQFPTLVVRMIAMAESTGNLSEVLRQITASYVEEVEQTLKRILIIIEPALILVIGGIVGFILVCLYYPIFNMANAFMAGS
jgi:type IV pilus assembly protein PilC